MNRWRSFISVVALTLAGCGATNHNAVGNIGGIGGGAPSLIPTLDQWHCYGFMVRANTPGKRDGRIAGWFDGKLAMDFMNLRLRDVASLTMDRISVGLGIGSNPNGIAKKWVDDLVVAKSYIGPLKK